jgi:hypothetical protein
MQAGQIRSEVGNLTLAIRLLSFFWLSTKFITSKLWLTNRLFPVVPIHDSIKAPGFIHLVLFVLSIAALLVLLYRPHLKKAAMLLLIAEVCSCLLDQNRWQPWEYQFIFMLLLLVFTNDENRLRTGWQVILIGLYFFSGLSKLNQKFILQGWNGMILHDYMGYTTGNTWVHRIGYLIPLMEIVSALGLLFNKCRKIAVVLLCGMHGFILLMFGPLGLNINIALWPWNTVMPFLLVILFYHKQLSWPLIIQKKPLIWVTIFCWWVLPWLNLFGKLDDFFSAKLFSGKTQYLFICTTNPDSKKLFKPYFASSSMSPACDSSISFFKWGIQEMHVPPNPELRIYKKIIQQWEQKYDTAHADKFMILNPKFAEEKWALISGESK